LMLVVTPKSGQPVSGLQQQDFTVLDNNVSADHHLFPTLRGREAPIEVVVVIDDVNTGLEHVPTSGRRSTNPSNRWRPPRPPHHLAFLTDSGIKAQGDFSSDGNALSARVISPPSGYTLSSAPAASTAPSNAPGFLEALLQLATHEAARQAQVHCLDFSRLPLLSGPASRYRWTQSKSSGSSTMW